MAADRKLTELKRFWFALGIPIFGCAFTAITISANSNLYRDWSFKGFNKAAEIFHVPISILLLALPLVALVATIHRSAQTSKALKRSAEQNSISNYFSHRKEFRDLLTSMEKELGVWFFDADGLYALLFPTNKSSQPELLSFSSTCNEGETLELETLVVRFNHLMNSIKGPSFNLSGE